MVSYAKIVRDAFVLTIHNRILWLFGLFAVGGFNANFFHEDDWQVISSIAKIKIPELLSYLQDHPGVLALASAILLVVSVVGLAITNWSRVMLVLSAESLIKNNYLSLADEAKKSKPVLWPVIKMSLYTSAVLVAAAAGFLLPPLLLAANSQNQQMVLAVGAIIFLVLAYTVSYINIFTTFFIILFKKSVSRGLNLGTDFFISRWGEILALSMVIFLIYAVSIMGGIAIIYAVRVFLYFLGSFLAEFGFLSFSAIILVTRLVYSVLLWVWLAGLSVFFNTVWLMFFLETVTPIKAEEAKARPVVPLPASAA